MSFWLLMVGISSFTFSMQHGGLLHVKKNEKW